MSFVWDDIKNQSNIQKHGVSFEEARRIFDAPTLTTVDERRDVGEVRKLRIGKIDVEPLVKVAHTERDGNIRLISARPASRRERKIYCDQVR